MVLRHAVVRELWCHLLRHRRWNAAVVLLRRAVHRRRHTSAVFRVVAAGSRQLLSLVIVWVRRHVVIHLVGSWNQSEWNAHRHAVHTHVTFVTCVSCVTCVTCVSMRQVGSFSRGSLALLDVRSRVAQMGYAGGVARL